MTNPRTFPLVVLALALALTGCRKDAESPRPEAETASVRRPEAAEPARVAVQHILIAFKGSIPKDTVTRTREEAQRLALEIYRRAGSGEDFDALVKTFTDDEYPGIYRMANAGFEPNAAAKEYPRTGMVKSFGNVSFGLEVGGIGLAVYHPASSKYGWHIIKRLE